MKRELGNSSYMHTCLTSFAVSAAINGALNAGAEHTRLHFGSQLRRAPIISRSSGARPYGLRCGAEHASQNAEHASQDMSRIC
jgi:hypothetical protein